MEGKANFSRRLKQFDGLTWLALIPVFYDRSMPLRLYDKLTIANTNSSVQKSS